MALLLASTCSFAFGNGEILSDLENQNEIEMIERASRESAALANLYFCVQASQGVEDLYYTGTECDEVIQSALEAGATEERIENQIIRALKKAAMINLAQCAQNNFEKASVACEDRLNEVYSLGISKESVKEEIEFLSYFLFPKAE